MSASQTMGRSNSKKHYHQQSMDDFMKNIKKFNLRSERYISPKPLLYMYCKNNTTNTIQKSRSRTLSNNKSQRSKEKRKLEKSKAIKNKLESIFKQKGSEKKQGENPANFIQKWGEKIRKAEKYLESKSNIGFFLCTQFRLILNELVEKMVKQLDQQLNQISEKTEKHIERKYHIQIDKLNRKISKMDTLIKQLNSKAESNSRLVYNLRLVTQLDVDYMFGKSVLGTDMCGGQGYSKYEESNTSYSAAGFQILKENEEEPEEQEKGLKLENLKNLKKDEFRYQQENEQQQGQEQESRIRQAYRWQKEAHDVKKLKKQETEDQRAFAQFFNKKRKST